MSITSIMVNIMFSRADRKRDAGLQTPADVERRDNLSYGSGGKWQLLDVYLPRERAGRLPVIINIHGGGWVYGSKEVYQYYGMSLAQRGFAVVNFNYRLAPASKFPAPIEDTNRVIHWVQQQAGEYPFDLQHIFLVGDSAGANTAAAYACLCTNPEYVRFFPFQPPAGFIPTAVGLNCGVYHPASAASLNKGFTALLKDYLGRLYPDGMDLMDVTRHINNAFPPTSLVTADYDFVKPQAPILAEKLAQLQIRHEYKIYGNGNEAVGHVFHCNMRLPEAAQCNDEQCAFFKSLMT